MTTAPSQVEAAVGHVVGQCEGTFVYVAKLLEQLDRARPGGGWTLLVRSPCTALHIEGHTLQTCRRAQHLPACMCSVDLQHVALFNTITTT